MRELELFGQWLSVLRQEKLQKSHQALLATDDVNQVWARVYAYEAELVSYIREALLVLQDDPGKFVDKYRKKREGE